MEKPLTDYKQSSEDYQRIEQAIQYLETHYKDQPNLDEVAATVLLRCLERLGFRTLPVRT